MIAAVLWDMDGTIVDSEPAWVRAQGALAARFGCAWTPADALALIGSTMEQTVRALQAAGVALADSDIEAALERDVLAEMRRGLSWRPGARELLREVHRGESRRRSSPPRRVSWPRSWPMRSLRRCRSRPSSPATT
ncbi:HAD family phosphatase [Rathayibacter oskolensis]|uniref:HAD family hydrolase n=1 Tax=Rathayibacter oskolensis TaxID=1891671 RepID=UPI00265FA979|nr:HAD family phosphatase [Rathayibacter oskolensis]WKK72441.1 HAD family phosphatase [Rathayibacter oskolensis]